MPSPQQQADAPPDQFLELALPCHDLQSALGFYRDLGFTELPSGDIREHYAIVTDGRIALGLHDAVLEEPALVFVHADVARYVRRLQDAGVEMVMSHLGEEQFNEAAFETPDGHLAWLVEAPTYSASLLEDAPPSLLGRCGELGLRCRDLDAAVEFWEDYGFIADPASDEDDAWLMGPGITLGLHRDQRRHGPLLVYEDHPLAEVRAALAGTGIDIGRAAGEAVIDAPDGVRIVLREP